jgi:hypothetical protein
VGGFSSKLSSIRHVWIQRHLGNGLAGEAIGDYAINPNYLHIDINSLL